MNHFPTLVQQLVVFYVHFHPLRRDARTCEVTLCQYQLCEWFGSSLLPRYPFHLETHHESCDHEGTVPTLQMSQY